jgi:phospholipase C
MRPLRPCLLLAASLALLPSARADDLTLTDQPGPRQLVSLGGNRILEWNPTTGGYRVWNYDATASGGTNPLILPAVASGNWSTIVTGHELLYVGDDVVLDWEPLTGGYRFWHYDRNATGGSDPLPGAPIASGTFNSIRTGHKLLYLGDVAGDAKPARILDWELDSGRYRVWRYDRTATGGTNPFLTQNPSPVATDTFGTIHAGHELITVNSEHVGAQQVLDFEPATGNYRLFDVNGDATGATNPLQTPAHTSGTFNTVGLGHRLLYLRGSSRVLDWEPVTGHNRVWSFNPNVSSGSNPLSGPVTNYTWSSVVSSTPKITTKTNIKHLVVIEMENKSFDSYFGAWCTGGHSPTCNTAGWPGFSANMCCEAGPTSYTSEGGTVFHPYTLDNAENLLTDRNHSYTCQVKEMNGGAMNRFMEPNIALGDCQSDRNFAYSHGADGIIDYYQLADAFALADHYFQPTAGASASNDVFLAGAHFYFRDNKCTCPDDDPTCQQDGIKPECVFDRADDAPPMDVGALLWTHGVAYTVYAGRLHETSHAFEKKDNGFAYFRDRHTRDPREPDHTFLRDLDQLQWDLDAGTLPSVSLVKPDNHDSEHPGGKLSDGVDFSMEVINRVLGSQFASRTLIVLVYDESGGFYDHMRPPPAWPTSVDSQPDPDNPGAVLPVPYGPRVPMMTIGRFSRQAYISHKVMEHSSLVKFIEWNWLGGHSGQLDARDKVVNNIGDMLDPAETGVTVPSGASD